MSTDQDTIRDERAIQESLQRAKRQAKKSSQKNQATYQKEQAQGAANAAVPERQSLSRLDDGVKKQNREDNRQRAQQVARTSRRQNSRTAKALVNRQIEEGIDPEVLRHAEIEDVLREIALELRQQIAAGNFSAFVFVLFLAALKDTIDVILGIPSLGLPFIEVLDVIYKIIFVPLFWWILYVSFFARLKRMKRAVRNILFRQAWRITMIMIFSEVAPIIDMAPMTVIAVIWLKYDMDKARKKLEREAEEVNQTLKEI